MSLDVVGVTRQPHAHATKARPNRDRYTLPQPRRLTRSANHLPRRIYPARVGSQTLRSRAEVIEDSFDSDNGEGIAIHSRFCGSLTHSNAVVEKFCNVLPVVIAGLVPAIPLRRARCAPERDARVKPAHDVERFALDWNDVKKPK
jgi:hypothetical protein